jgi:hypothetical protein
MSDKKKELEQAFPVPAGHMVGAEIWQPQEGMTLRDYFAAKAMAALIAASVTDDEIKIARWAYSQADAMLTERESRVATPAPLSEGGRKSQ